MGMLAEVSGARDSSSAGRCAEDAACSNLHFRRDSRKITGGLSFDFALDTFNHGRFFAGLREYRRSKVLLAWRIGQTVTATTWRTSMTPVLGMWRKTRRSNCCAFSANVA